jgi:protein required for attachment to host cells
MGTYIILTADEGHARFFTCEKHDSVLGEIKSLINPDARVPEKDLVSNGSSGNYHDPGHQGEAHEHAAHKFARLVSDTLEKTVARHKPAGVYVLAAPDFLGLLRSEWSQEMSKRIKQEIDKDVSQQSGQQIRAQLPEYL